MPTANLDQASPLSGLSDNFEALRAQLADLAVALERRKRLDAADAAMSLHALIGEMREELDASEERAVSAGAG